MLVLDKGQALAAGPPAEITAAVPARPSRWPSGPATRKNAALAAQAAVARLAAAGVAGRPARSSPTCRTRCAWPNCTGASACPSPWAECTAVSRAFGSFTAVDRVDLAVRARRGGRAARWQRRGQDHLIRLLLGLLPPAWGRAGPAVRPAAVAPTRRRIGYVPQTLGLYDDLTVAENLAFSGAVFSAPAGLPLRCASTPAPWSATCRWGAGGRRSPRPWRTHRTCCCSTSRPPGWTRWPGPGCGRRSARRPRRVPAS